MRRKYGVALALFAAVPFRNCLIEFDYDLAGAIM